MNTPLQDLLKSPTCPDKEFISGGTTIGEVYAMAAWLRKTWEDSNTTAICLAAENKAMMAAALLATLAGGPSLLLPYAFSARALERMQQATGFTQAISDVERAFPDGVEVLCPPTHGSGEIPVSPHASPRNELLKIFTGGSTGSPQVWAKSCANIFSEAFFLADHFKMNDQDCIVTTIPPYHIYGLLFSVVLPLVSSARVIHHTPSFPGDILETIENNNCTILASVPPHYRVLRDKKIAPSSPLRLAFSSAGMLDPGDNQSFYTNNNVGIVEVYGSTETGGIATRNRSLGEDNFTPMKEIDWQIINQRLAVRSPYISPDLPVNDAGFFVTGDRVEAGGINEFILKGRVDGVTKVGGKRVDLEEIRGLIKKQAGVSDCVVQALHEPGGREHRIVTLVQGEGVNPTALKKTLKESLESYAMPRRIQVVDHIPLQKNGKYDRAAILKILDA